MHFVVLCELGLRNQNMFQMTEVHAMVNVYLHLLNVDSMYFHKSRVYPIGNSVTLKFTNTHIIITHGSMHIILSMLAHLLALSVHNNVLHAPNSKL